MLYLPTISGKIGALVQPGDFSGFNRVVSAWFVQNVGRPPTNRELYVCQWNWTRPAITYNDEV